MDFYYFGGYLGNNEYQQIIDLEEHHFTGTLFTYNPLQGDIFTLVARNINTKKKLKYMVAVRPHALSPQYLCMINQSINSIMPNRLQINLIAGHIKPNEKDFGGILGDTTDYSSVEDRSNHLIEYLDELKKMSEKSYVQIPDFYVSSTNIYLFEAAAKHDFKIILPYRNYKSGHFLDTSEHGKTKPGEAVDIANKRIMLAVGPIIRETQKEIDEEFPKNIKRHHPDGREYLDRERHSVDTEYFTYDQFAKFIEKLESKGIHEVMLHGWPMSERERVFKYVKRYVESKKAVD